MTTRTWNGSSDAFTNGADWSPAGVPMSGDTAVITSGTVLLSSTPTGVTIQLVEPAGATSSDILSLSGVTLDSTTPLIVINNQTSFSSAPPTLTFSGTNVFSGTESFYGTRIQLTINSGSTLVNTGAMNFYGSSPLVNGGGTLTNNGTIALVNPGSAIQSPVFSDNITGTGQIALGTRARIEISGAVSSGQTLVFNDGSTGNEIAQLDTLGSFAGSINGFSSSDVLAVLTNQQVTSETYTSTGSNMGTLSLFAGSTSVGSLRMIGNYSTSAFTVNSVSLGNNLYNTQITTSVNNNVSSGLPAGYQNGSGSATPPSVATSIGAVYRFFDNTNGTHFFTSDIGERNTVLSTLSARYTEETNGFGDVAQSDSNATAVYRFFDTHYGTHFFTASATERDSVIATRPDLTYEPGSTFYEHATQQSGDVAVYRFFDTQYGTHFYTGDAGEFTGLTSVGSATYRANLTYEGVGFYAPSGTFT